MRAAGLPAFHVALIYELHENKIIMPDSSAAMFASVSAVTFDAGGTLVVPDPSVSAIYSEVFSQHGIASDPVSVEIAFRRAWRKFGIEGRGPTNEAREITKWRRIVAATLEGLDPPDDFDALFDDLWQTFSEPRRWRVREGGVEVLSHLNARGIRLAVLSNWDSRLRPLLNGLGLAEYFEAFFISSEIGWEKPHPRIFQVAAAHFGLPASGILHVGDSIEEDFEAARTAGWNAVLIDAENVEHLSNAPLRDGLPKITGLRKLPDLIWSGMETRPPPQ